jgi:uncharacterized protein DUF4255
LRDWTGTSTRRTALGRLVSHDRTGDAPTDVIEDVDESLRALVRRDALNGSGVEVAFDAPTKDWAARRNTPTVDLYLYDIREDLRRREVAWEEVRDKSGRVTDRRPPPRHYKLSYLVTAWTQRPEDEHRLLSTLLSCFIRNETIPKDMLAGSLAGTDLPVYTTIALPPPQDRSLSDVWTALGGELKPSLDLVVTTPIVDPRSETTGPPVLEEPRVRVDGETAVGRRAKPRQAEPTLDPAIQDEKIVGGVAPNPGRVVRLRGSSRS